MKNMTFAIVPILAAVAMLSAGLAVSTQVANAENGGSEGGNSVEINQEHDCERA